jgi:hypothetical protein
MNGHIVAPFRRRPGLFRSPQPITSTPRPGWGRAPLAGGSFHGGLFLEGAQLRNRGSVTLGGDRMNVRGPVECSSGFHSVGTVSLRGSQIGSLCLDGAMLECPGGYVLHADHLGVTTYLRGGSGAGHGFGDFTAWL